MEYIKTKVCIIGAGSAGMGAAYALRNLGKDLVVVEKFSELGGTVVNAWVETWINGINLPYILEAFNILIDKGYIITEDVKNSWVGKQFAKNKNCRESIYIPRKILAVKYMSDMNAAGVLIMNNSTFVNAIKDKDELERVNSVVVQQNNKMICITADYFIDSSGSGILCRSINSILGKDFLIGEDSYNQYQESLAPLNPNSNGYILNEPSLLYMVGQGKKEQSKVLEFSSQILPSQISTDGYIDDYYSWKSPGWLNPMTGLGGTGKEALDNEDGLYRKFSETAQFQHWALVKKGMETNADKDFWKGYCPKRQRNYIHLGQWAPMLGIRESYRIVCERMLTQQDLTVQIDARNLQDYIACGSHCVDMHINGNIDRNKINDFNKNQLKPGGIPFDCIRPKHLSNVLIACKAYGASHIALSCRRTNKEMAQLGWAAGHATMICLEEHYDKYSEISSCHQKLQELQTRIKLKESVEKMEELM